MIETKDTHITVKWILENFEILFFFLNPQNTCLRIQINLHLKYLQSSYKIKTPKRLKIYKLLDVKKIINY